MFRILICIALIWLSGGVTVRVSDKIYQQLQGDMACFKRFNGTHEVGCTSDFNGNVGVLYIPDNFTDIQWILENGANDPYMLGVNPSLFTRETLMLVKASLKISGMVILDSQEDIDEPETFSPAESCPSENYGIYNESSGSVFSGYCKKNPNPWNPSANSIMFESFNFPIFLMQDEQSIKGMRDCFETNKGWPLCALQLNSHMFGASNSEVCWRRAQLAVLNTVNYCDPILDYNVFGSLLPMMGNLTNSSVTVISARADAASIFDNVSPGAESAVTGIVTLLAVAKALGENKSKLDNTDKNIMFFLFEGEVWDYLGSFIVTYQMNQGIFPYIPDYTETSRVSVFNYSHIEHFIELSQLGIQGQDTDTKLFLFNDPISDSDGYIQSNNVKLREAISTAAEKYNVIPEYVSDETGKPYPLPPASFQSFLKFKNISGVVLADHGKTYNNKYYQSFLDNSRYLKFNQTNSTSSDSDGSTLGDHLKKIASTVATAAFKIISGTDQSIEPDIDFINELLYCYLVNRNCTLFRNHAGAYLHDSKFFINRPAKMYASVERGEYILSNITQNILHHVLGDEIDVSAENCSSGYKDAVHKVFIPTLGENGTCFNSTVFMQSTRNPAFTDANYNFSSGEFPTWAESGWQSTSARLFLLPSLAEEIGLVIGGVIITIISVLISCFCFAKTDVLFEKIPVPAQC